MVDISADAPIGAETDFTIGDILGESLSILRRGYGKFFPLVAMFMLPDLIVQLLIAQSASSGSILSLTQAASLGRFWSFALSLLQTFAQVAVISGAFAYLSGQPLSIGDAWRSGSGRYGSAFRTAVLQGIGVLIGFVLLVVPGFIFLAMWYVALPVCVIEHRSATDSLNRSAALTKGHRWSVLGIMLVATVGGIALEAIAIELADQIAGGIVSSFVDYVMQIVVLSFAGIVGAVLFHRLRLAKEGPGVEMLAEVFA